MPQDEIKFNIKGQEFLVNLNKGTVKTSDLEWKKWESVFLEIAMADGEKGVSGKELGSMLNLVNYLENFEVEKEEDLYNLFMDMVKKYGGNVFQFINDQFVPRIELPKLKPNPLMQIECDNEKILKAIQKPIPDDIQLQGHYQRLSNKDFYNKEGVLISSTKSTVWLNRDEGTYIIETTRQNNNGEDITTSYVVNKSELEDYIINNSFAERNNKRHYADIEQIRNIPEHERTQAQIDLLNEFDSMVTSIIEAGCEYGIDPRLITAIIKQETGFNYRCVGNKGQGLMQITSSPVDYMLRAVMGSYSSKIANYFNTDFVDLCKSRGIDITNLKTDSDVNRAKQQIISLLNNVEKTGDYDFNIKLGTILLRYNLDRAKGNVSVATRNYNGSSLKYEYSRCVTGFYNTLCGKEKATYTIK